MAKAAARQDRLKLTAPVVPEHDMQRSVVKLLRLAIGPEAKPSKEGVVWFSIDHANSHNEVPGIRVGRGIASGIWDMLVLYQGRSHWIELKSKSELAILSEPQRSMAPALLLSGCKIGVARDADEVLMCLTEWEIPHRKLRLAA